MVGAIAAYDRARAKLREAGVTDSLEARVLFELATGLKRAGLERGDEITDRDASALESLVARRVSGEPLQYIAGSWPFLDFELSVGAGALIPRPETELIVHLALSFLKTREHPAALDLCSGTGCAAIAIKRALPDCAVTALERSSAALEYLKKNVSALAEGVEVAEDDVFGYERLLAPSSLECILCNPPYLMPGEYDGNRELEYEPREAFVGGADGLDFYRYITPNYKSALKKGGMLIFETGSEQTEAVASLLRDAGYRGVDTCKDIFGNGRAAFGRA